MAVKLLRIAETAQRLGVAEQTLRNWRVQQVGPQAAKIGNKLVWREDDVDAYIRAQFEKAVPAA